MCCLCVTCINHIIAFVISALARNVVQSTLSLSPLRTQVTIGTVVDDVIKKHFGLVAPGVSFMRKAAGELSIMLLAYVCMCDLHFEFQTNK